MNTHKAIVIGQILASLETKWRAEKMKLAHQIYEAKHKAVHTVQFELSFDISNVQTLKEAAKNVK